MSPVLDKILRVVALLAILWGGLHFLRDALDLGQLVDYRNQMAQLRVERDNVQLQLNELRKNIRTRNAHGECLCLPKGVKP